MFTGIIEEIGKINTFKRTLNGADIVIGCSKVLEETQIGDSIAVNGCCQTVVEIGKNFFRANLSEETLKVTNFSDAKVGDEVNLERALTLNTRLGGHIVSGHIDCLGSIAALEPLTIKIDENNMKYVVKKGSVTINGISLTVANVENNSLSVAIIPHTLANTNLRNVKVADIVNIETDILAKYVENLLLKSDNNENNTKIDKNFLEENGFI